LIHCRASVSGNSDAVKISKNLDASKLRGLETLDQKEGEEEELLLGNEEAVADMLFTMI
jgi:hypothetical protein